MTTAEERPSEAEQPPKVEVKNPEGAADPDETAPGVLSGLFTSIDSALQVSRAR